MIKKIEKLANYDALEKLEFLDESLKVFQSRLTVNSDADAWDVSETEFKNEILKYDGEPCVAILDISNYTGDPRDDYYNITFEDGTQWYAVSGYELDLDNIDNKAIINDDDIEIESLTESLSI